MNVWIAYHKFPIGTIVRPNYSTKGTGVIIDRKYDTGVYGSKKPFFLVEYSSNNAWWYDARLLVKIEE